MPMLIPMPFRTACVLFLLACVAGCAQTTDIHLRFQQPATQPTTSLLIAANTNDPMLRSKWEDACKHVFNTHQLTLVESHNVLPDWHSSDPSALLHWANGHEISTLLVANINMLLMQPTNFENPQSGPGLPSGPIDTPTWQFTLQGEKIDNNNSSSNKQHIHVQLLAASGKVYLDALLVTHEANNIEAIAASQCRALKRNMEKTGLLGH